MSKNKIWQIFYLFQICLLCYTDVVEEKHRLFFRKIWWKCRKRRFVQIRIGFGSNTVHPDMEFSFPAGDMPNLCMPNGGK